MRPLLSVPFVLPVYCWRLVTEDIYIYINWHLVHSISCRQMPQIPQFPLSFTCLRKIVNGTVVLRNRPRILLPSTVTCPGRSSISNHLHIHAHVQFADRRLLYCTTSGPAGASKYVAWITSHVNVNRSTFETQPVLHRPCVVWSVLYAKFGSQHVRRDMIRVWSTWTMARHHLLSG